jgi:hypothetical protein
MRFQQTTAFVFAALQLVSTVSLVSANVLTMTILLAGLQGTFFWGQWGRAVKLTALPFSAHEWSYTVNPYVPLMARTRIALPYLLYSFFLFTPHMKIEQTVPKRRHIKFRGRGFAQKKEYNVQNKMKV